MRVHTTPPLHCTPSFPCNPQVLLMRSMDGVRGLGLVVNPRQLGDAPALSVPLSLALAVVTTTSPGAAASEMQSKLLEQWQVRRPEDWSWTPKQSHQLRGNCSHAACSRRRTDAGVDLLCLLAYPCRMRSRCGCQASLWTSWAECMSPPPSGGEVQLPWPALQLSTWGCAAV